MPVNRNALIRYRTIDNCLRNRFRKWTLDDLIDACSEALYEYEGIDKGVSKRTVQMDIQFMRSDKLGYNAPIIVGEKKYYTYQDPDYSITDIPLTDQDLGKLTEVVDILRQFKGFTHFRELQGMVQRLEDKIHTSKTHQPPIIDLEKNENLKGLEHIDGIYQAILNRNSLMITYQSFKAREANTFLFHPALLKEFRNRWFLLGKKKRNLPFLLLALDRMESIETADHPMIKFDQTKISNYFKNVIGVSVNDGETPQEVQLFVDHSSAPYVLTKPLHHSQKLMERNDQGIIISLFIQPNFELEREILGFGDSIKVIAPTRLRSRIKERFNHAIDLYQTELNEKEVKHFDDRLKRKGYVITNHVYTKREIRKMGLLLHRYLEKDPSAVDSQTYAIGSVVKKIPDLKILVFNRNLKRILSKIDPGFFLSKATYFNKSPQSNWYVTWHQDTIINVVAKRNTNGFTGWTKKESGFGVEPTEEVLHKTLTVRIHLDDVADENGALNIMPGSHKKKLNLRDINLITSSNIPTKCEVRSGGIQLMKPLLLHASSRSSSQKQRRVIYLEFNSVDLPNGLQWAEKELLG